MGKISSVRISTIPHNHQRYKTVGDWLYDEASESVTILVSDMGDWRKGLACGIHELIETALCVQDGVSEESVSAFDVAYEEARRTQRPAPCGCVPTEDSEPGEDRHAPYRRQHAFADGVERLFANAIGLVWDEYAETVVNLPYHHLSHDPFGENGEATEDADG
jgi:hypothetical protein